MHMHPMFGFQLCIWYCVNFLNDSLVFAYINYCVAIPVSFFNGDHSIRSMERINGKRKQLIITIKRV